MGSRNVELVLEQWMPLLRDNGRPLLSHNGLRVLLRMAYRSLDSKGRKGEPARLYFAGRDDLILALRPEVPTDRAALRSARQCVKVAVAELVDVGATERLSVARDGTRQTYRLRLDSGVAKSYPSKDAVRGNEVLPLSKSSGVRNSCAEGYVGLTPYESIEDSKPEDSTEGRQVPPSLLSADDVRPANADFYVDSNGVESWRCRECRHLVTDCPCPERSA